MAKKQKVNPLEAHFEKAILFLAVVALGWVVFTCFIDKTGVEIKGDIKTPKETALEASKLAQAAVDKMKQPPQGGAPVRSYVPVADKIFEGVTPIKVSSIPIGPNSSGLTDFVEKRIYKIPDIFNEFNLKSVNIELTHSLAIIPKEKEAGSSPAAMQNGGMGMMPMPMGMGMGMGMPAGSQDGERDDIDFVTVSGIFPMKMLYDEFKKSFYDVNKSLELYEPIVAMVELQHQQQLPDGSWGKLENVSRLKVDPIVGSVRSLDEINQLTPATFEDMVKRNASYQHQLLILKPQTYNLVDTYTLAVRSWQTPEEREQLAKMQEGNQRNQRNQPAGGMGMMGPGMMGPGMMGPGMMGPGMMGPGMMGGNQPGRAGGNAALNTEELHFWAHDEQVVPGGLYRYRIRLGFYNPVAGKPWVSEAQKDLMDQRILWTKWDAPEKSVRVPMRTVFFPKSAGSNKKDVANVEVYRYQKGKWYKRSFSVTPGAMIGEVKTTRIKTLDPVKNEMIEENVEIDYRTGMTVVDIIPNSSHVSVTGAKVTCTDITYRDANGMTKTRATRSDCWDRELIAVQKSIKAAMTRQRDEEKKNRFLGGGMDRMPRN